MTDVTIAPVRKSVRVEASPAHCFKVFTTDLFLWWPKSHALHTGIMTHSEIEPFVGGRFYARFDDGQEIDTGHVTAWEPPTRLIFTWEISGDWKPHPGAGTASEIEVLFRADGPDATIVAVEHRNFERMEQGGDAMRATVDSAGGWTGILQLFAAFARQSRDA